MYLLQGEQERGTPAQSYKGEENRLIDLERDCRDREESGGAEQVIGEIYTFLFLRNDIFEDGSTRHSQKKKILFYLFNLEFSQMA